MLAARVCMHKMPHFQLGCVYSGRVTYQGCQTESPAAQKNFPGMPAGLQGLGPHLFLSLIFCSYLVFKLIFL